jgi:hypothetical protein
MNAPRRTPSGLLVTLLLLTALSPLATVQAQPEQASEYYYGVEYDWTSLDSDLQNVTGLDIQALFTEIMDDATDAGFNLDLGQLTTGATNIYVHQTEDISTQTVQDADGNNVNVWSRTSDVTLRHGLLSNAVVLTDWEDDATFGSDPASFDIDVIAEAENVLTVDIMYTEYLNDAYELVGADMVVDMTVGNDMNLGVDIVLAGGGEEMTVNFDTGINFEYSIASDAVWRMGSNSPIYIEAAENDYTSWECVEDAMDVGVQEWGDEAYVYDDCGMVDGSYTGSADYEVYFTGLPTEEFGLDAGLLDISLSDAFQNAGDYTEPAELGWVAFSMDTSEPLEVDLGDGTTIEAVACDTCPPGNPVMFSMLGNVLAYASVSFGEAVAEDFEAQLDESVSDLIADWFGEDAEGVEWDNSEYEWTCDNGEIIDIWSVNDGWEDCEDGSDEMDFYLQSNEGQDDEGNPVYGFYGGLNPAAIGMDDGEEELWFMCADGMYDVPFSYVNDGGDDCDDGSDEAQYGEETTMMECADGLDTIVLSWVNDGMNDCEDGSDESQYDETTGEETTMFTCADGSDAIVLSWVNDDYEDCADGSDESQYEESTVFTCDDSSEIPFSWANDGEMDCADGSDEMTESEVADDWFTCSDWSTSVPFQWINDGEADCEDGSDEYDASNPTDFSCDEDGATISFEAVNDGDEDCNDGSDEGSALYMMLSVWMYDDDNNMVMNADDLMVCSNWSCDAYYTPGDNLYFSTDVPLTATMDYGAYEQCIGAELHDAMGSLLIDMDYCETGWNGPSIDHVNMNSDGYEIELWAEASDWNDEYDDVTLVVSLYDESENALESWTTPFGGTSGADFWEYYDVSATGEYCVVAELIADGETLPFESQSACGEVIEEPEPSERLVTIVEALADSSLEEVLTAFGENLEQTFTDVAENQETPEFPYVDGMWAPLWSTEHATIVGVGVYAWDEDDNAYVIAGPETTGYSNDLPMVFASINYITGVTAEEAQTAMADIDTIEDIVDVENHDLDTLADALEEAGVDTSTIDLPDNTDDTTDGDDPAPTAEDIAEDAGLLPFMSPFALVAMIGLAVAFAQARRDTDE